MSEYEKLKMMLDMMMSDDDDELAELSATLTAEGFGKVELGLTKAPRVLKGPAKEWRLKISALNSDLHMTLWFDGYEQRYNNNDGHDNMLFIFRDKGRLAGSLSIHEYDDITVEHDDPTVYKEVSE